MRCFVSMTIVALATESLAATIPPTDNISLPRIDNLLVNATALNAIDPRFTTTTQRQGPNLDVDAFLFSVVNAMATFALLNFNEATIARTPTGVGSPGVVIEPRAAQRGGTIENRFLVWGLYAGVRGLIFFEIFQEVELTLNWDGIAVGYLKIMKSRTPLTLPASGNTSTLALPYVEQEDSPSPHVTARDIGVTGDLAFPNLPEATRPEVHFTKSGKPLRVDGVIITILRFLLNIAPFDKDAPLRPIQVSGPSPYEVTILMGPNRPAQGRAIQPFTYAMAALSLLSVPQRALARGVWREARFDVMLGDVAVGKGAVVLGRR